MRDIICTSLANANAVVAAINSALTANGMGAATPWETPRDNGDTTYRVQDPRQVITSVDIEGALTTAINGAATVTLTKPFLPKVKRVGNRFVDSNGNVLDLRGVSIDIISPSYNGKTAAQRLDQLYNDPATRWSGTNMFRMPVSPSEAGANPAGHLKTYMDPAIAKCYQYGTYGVIDLHYVTNYDTAAIDASIRAFWNYTCTRYRYESVFFEMFNEPVGTTNIVGDNVNSPEGWNYWKSIAQPWVDLMRERAPEVPILIGSPVYDQATHHAVGREFTGTNLGYVSHWYTTHFPGGTPVTSATDQQRADWFEDKVTVVSDVMPIVWTEKGYSSRPEDAPASWGNFDEGGEIWYTDTRARFITPMLNFLGEHPEVGFTSWCYSTTSGPKMLNRDFSFAANPFSVTNGSPTMTVTRTSHGLVAGDLVRFVGATDVGGISAATHINKDLTVASVVDANTFTVTLGANATSTAVGGGSAAYIFGLEDMGFVLRSWFGLSDIRGLSATPGDAQVALSWTAPTAHNITITDYVVEYKLAADAAWSVFDDGVSTTTSATVTGLTNGQVYDFRVRAKDAEVTGRPTPKVQATPTA